MPAPKREFTSIDRLQRQHAAQIKWSKTDPVEGTRAAREKFLANFLVRVDEHAAEQGETLSDGERMRRAESLRKAHFTELSRKSAIARSAKKRVGAA